MADVIYVLVTIGFFAGAVGFVGLCDRILGRDELPDPASADALAPTPTDTPEPAHAGPATTGALR